VYEYPIQLETNALHTQVTIDKLYGQVQLVQGILPYLEVLQDDIACQTKTEFAFISLISRSNQSFAKVGANAY